MSFTGIADLSGTIKLEGEKISAEFLPTVPQVGQGTVTWNIPTPVSGCSSQSSVNSAYCGILVVASRTFLGAQNIPQNGKKYTADPTLDPELHVGDVIGDANGEALVIGAFYEGDKKANGEDMTTSMVVNDYDADENYYIGVYAVSCTLEYHSDGIRAYSDGYGDAKVADRLRKKLDQWSVTLPRLNKSDRDASEVFAWPLEGAPAGTKPPSTRPGRRSRATGRSGGRWRLAAS